MISDGLLPAFDNPVFGAQAAFRAVLAALAEPGTIHVAGLDLAPPAPLMPAAAAVLLALADADTGMRHDGGPVADAFLRFHCGAPDAALSDAAFVLATGAMPPLATLASGTDEIPSAGATLVVQVASLSNEAGWHLTGPGILGARHLNVAGLPADFPAQWAANRGAFPRGVDVVLCAGTALAALPRSVTLEA
ncbi:phosphonate C-P lyase system protein PhnH [Humitalea sp. 24SJ18S-53]|uniref:phosphonate C-P lyase system protein PhnH n=1 Tax=Humitalea sp. 24SJ18S-53 TaxID=3422307 RepID=UPI003D673E86